MAAHTTEQFEFIVRRLAACKLDADIVREFRAKWTDTACKVEDIAACDPERGLTDPAWCKIFDAARAKFLASPYASPTSQRQVRLAWYHSWATFYRNNNQPAESRAVLRQIKEETDVVGALGSSGDVVEVTRIRRILVDPAEPEAE